MELDSNFLYNLNQKNKLQKMNLENYLIEQITFLKNVINDIRKTRFWISKLEIFQNEVHLFFKKKKYFFLKNNRAKEL